MSWTENGNNTDFDNEYYLSKGNSRITEISIGEKVVYELSHAGKYAHFYSEDEAKQHFKELESQA